MGLREDRRPLKGGRAGSRNIPPAREGGGCSRGAPLASPPPPAVRWPRRPPLCRGPRLLPRASVRACPRVPVPGVPRRRNCGIAAHRKWRRRRGGGRRWGPGAAGAALAEAPTQGRAGPRPRAPDARTATSRWSAGEPRRARPSRPRSSPARGRRAPPQWPAALRGARGLESPAPGGSGSRPAPMRPARPAGAVRGARRPGDAGDRVEMGMWEPTRGPGRPWGPFPGREEPCSAPGSSLWGSPPCLISGALWASFTFLLAQRGGRAAGGTPWRKVQGLGCFFFFFLDFGVETKGRL